MITMKMPWIISLDIHAGMDWRHGGSSMTMQGKRALPTGAGHALSRMEHGDAGTPDQGGTFMWQDSATEGRNMTGMAAEPAGLAADA